MRHYRVTQDLDETDPPKEHEKAAAKILAEYFKSNLVSYAGDPVRLQI